MSMRTESQVRHRLKQVAWKYFKLRLSRELDRRLENCKYSLRRSLASGETQWFCSYGAHMGVQDRCAYANCVHECCVFALKKTRDQVELEFIQDFKRPLFKRHNMKDLVQLEWVLGMSEDEAGEYESKFLVEFLAYLEYRQRLSKKWYYRLYKFLTDPKLLKPPKECSHGRCNSCDTASRSLQPSNVSEKQA